MDEDAEGEDNFGGGEVRVTVEAPAFVMDDYNREPWSVSLPSLIHCFKISDEMSSMQVAPNAKKAHSESSQSPFPPSALGD